MRTRAPPGFGGGPQELNLSRWENKRLLLIGAHPDDIEFFAGKLTRARAALPCSCTPCALRTLRTLRQPARTRKHRTWWRSRAAVVVL